MARIIDESKLERVHLAAMSLIVKNGYGGASISAIAKAAEVSEGYLYRFYLGKEELVNVLLNTKIKAIGQLIEGYLENHENAKTIIRKLVEEISNMGLNNPVEVKFLYVMLSSYNFEISQRIKEFLVNLCSRIRNLAIEQSVFGECVSIDHFFNMVIIYPIQYINLRLKNFGGEGGFSVENKESLMNFCIKALSVNCDN